MKIQSSRLLAIAVAVAGTLGMAGNALATNGYFSIGYGAGSEGMGGVGVTSPQDSMCVGGNPACLGEFLAPQFDVGAGLFDARRRSGKVTLSGSPLGSDGNSWSGVNTFVIPGMGFVFPFNDELTIGFAAIGNGGMNTTYKPNFFSASAEGKETYVGVDMVQLMVPITVAYKVNKQHTLAASIVPAHARFLAQGLDALVSYARDTTPGSTYDNSNYVTNKGHDYANGMGARVGWLGHFMDDRVQLGATYASKVFMSKFQKYKGLFAGGGSFDIPANYAIGAAFKPVEDLTVAMDVEKILYSGIPSVANLGPTAFSATDPIPLQSGHALGMPEGWGFGWGDMTVYKLGFVYKNALPSWFGEKLTLRTGLNYGKSPVPEKQLLFNLLAPGVVEKHVTLGLTYSLGEQSIFGFGSEGLFTWSYQHAVKHSQSATLYFNQDPKIYNEAEMYQNAMTFAYTLKF